MVKKTMMAICMIALTVIGLISCGGDDSPAGPTVEMKNFTIDFINLEKIEGAVYEGWIIVDNEPISTGTFTGSKSEYTFKTVKESLENATSFVISIEPINDPFPDVPSNTKILSGDFVNDRAEITIDVIADFSQISGNFEIYTPSDTDPDNENNGIWFVKTVNDTKVAGLELPVLADGWKYEGWVIIDGVPVTTGTFSDPGTFDDSSPFSGNGPVPQFPGEDFTSSSVTSGGTTVTFPADGDVTGNKVIISLEPEPDNDSAPFYIKPLDGIAGDEVSPAPNSLTKAFTGASTILGTVER